ncbi:unnamed protein product [Protopolystoma xenopodis]|uniref:Uncharacterized protein n=1 Tax=Protopolystoma xenopodis TaxID=117903 RepID=A0A448XBN6_9PLAT|nr:unnamed protein product [Protopolystoma xenopodis]
MLIFTYPTALDFDQLNYPHLRGGYSELDTHIRCRLGQFCGCHYPHFLLPVLYFLLVRPHSAPSRSLGVDCKRYAQFALIYTILYLMLQFQPCLIRINFYQLS